ncbi:MAG: S9 family peptidase [Balneolaceae bacterium]|nr:S9 family peptidase [Balneolaceae bacterium]
MRPNPTSSQLISVLPTALLVLFILPHSLLAQSGAGLTPDQVAKIKDVGSIAISTDGNTVAYTLRVQADPVQSNETASYHLYIYNREDETAVPYVTDYSVSSVKFRPGYKTVTFLTRKEEDETTSLYEIRLDGGEAQKIFSFPTAIAGYDWSPDGDHLAFMASEPREQQEHDLPYQPEIYEENLVQRRGYVTNLAMKNHEPHRVQVEGSIYQLHWGPEGERLAVAAAPTPLVDDYYMHQHVYIVDHSGEEILGKVDHQGKLGQIAWSPNGQRLAMIAGADIHDTIDGRLFVVSSKGGTLENLVPDFQGKFEQFSWVDDNTLQYLASEGVWTTYGRIEADGSDMTTVLDAGGPIFSEFARADNGITAFVGDTPTHPDELFVMAQHGDRPERVTNSNPWLDDVTLGRQQMVTYKARDGLQIQGLLIYPVDYREGEQYPVITVVHGGPESHYSNGWLTAYSMAGQVGAARGYAVFYPNYRGSTGRGVMFAMSSQRDLAGAEFDDIVDGVDYLIDRGIADPDRVGVTGGSYGGYATGWLSTRYTDRFAAGVMFLGISDNISKWGTSDIPEELYLVHARQRIWEDYQFFLERSPIFHAGNADTPLLIMAGKEDTRVDPGQSYEMYRHLKTRTETPVRLVLYPGEGHGNARATARYDYNLRMLRWFDTYLKEGNRDAEKPSTNVGIETEEEMATSN